MSDNEHAFCVPANHNINFRIL